MSKKTTVDQTNELKELLLKEFNGKAIFFRDWSAAACVTQIRIDDMVYANDKWHLVTVYHKVDILDIQQPGAVVGQLSYLLDKEKAAVNS